MNAVFGFLVIASVLVAAFTGNVSRVSVAAVSSAGQGVKTVFGLIGILTLWLGVARIAEKSGLLQIMTRVLQPLVGWLFPGVPKGHPAMGAILMNFSANLFGFGSAATPFGLKAMEELQTLNGSDRASAAMCTFLAINVSSITLIPTTIVAIRINAGSSSPMEIIGPTLLASAVTTTAAIMADYYFRKRSGGRRHR